MGAERKAVGISRWGGLARVQWEHGAEGDVQEEQYRERGFYPNFDDLPIQKPKRQT